MLEVILKKDIDKLGDRGQVVKVKDGYARNFLYPQKLAIPASKGSLKQLAEMQAAAQREAVRLRGDAEKQAAALEGVVVRIAARAGREDRLFGSVTNRQIAAALAEQGLEIDRHRIDLKTPLRVVGDYDVPIRFYKDVEAAVKVEVRAEGREDEPLTAEEEPAGEAVEAETGETEAAEAEAAEAEPVEATEAVEAETAEAEAAEAESVEAAETESVETAEAEPTEAAESAAVEAAQDATAEAAEDEAAEVAESAAAPVAETAASAPAEEVGAA